MAIGPKPTVEPSRALLALAQTDAPAPLRMPHLGARAVRSPNAERPVTLGLPPALYEAYLTYAQSQGHPLAGILRQILTEGLPAAVGGGGRGVAPPSAPGVVARRTP
jgi:hypothetical protein